MARLSLPISFRLWLPVVAAVTALTVLPPCSRADPPSAGATPQEQAMQGLELVMKGLKGMIEQVPLYGPPEILPNGDIIVRRISPPPPGEPAPATAPAPAQRM